MCYDQLREMVAPGEVDATLGDEIRDECSKFGMIEKVVVFEDAKRGGAVRIFVLFITANGKRFVRSPAVYTNAQRTQTRPSVAA